METWEKTWCESVIEAMKSRPASEHVLDYPKECAVPVELAQIRAKLCQDEYVSVNDWSMDVYYLLYSICEYYESRMDVFRMALVQDFITWFALEVRRAPRTELAAQIPRADALKNRVELIQNVMKENLTDKRSEIRLKRPNQALIKDDVFNDLSERMAKISDVDTLLRIFLLLRQYVPDLKFGVFTEIKRSQIPRRCVEALLGILDEYESVC